MSRTEYWRWRYRDPATGQIRRTVCQLTAEEATLLLEATPIEGSGSLREVIDDFVDTMPEVASVLSRKQQA